MYHFIIILVIFILINLYLNKIDFFSLPKKNKIPYILFKTGPFDKIPTEILQVIQKSANKLNSNYYYFNDKSCEYFIKKYFPCSVFDAYNNLIPTAYKADLWRYCVLYKYGGIYGDLTQKFLVNYDVNEKNVDIVLVRDIKNDAIQISFIASKPKNNFIKYVIDNITNDILQKKKGRHCLDLTGPMAFCRYFKSYFKLKNIPEGVNKLKGLDNQFYIIRIDMRQKKGLIFKNIFNNMTIASTKTKEHNDELTRVTKMPKYYIYWNQNNIFK